MKEVRIGTSGWHYSHWRGPFYEAGAPAAAMLPFYIRHFDTVELNNSFYRLPAKETFQAWRHATPLQITADFVYARLHGPGGWYQGRYSPEMLRAWAGRICEWQAGLKGVYVYFDNDQEAFAARNALGLKTLVRKTGLPKADSR